jgi:hypothetical protein
MSDRARLPDRQPSKNFDDVAGEIAEVIEGNLSEKSRPDRPLELIRHHVRRATGAYRAGYRRPQPPTADSLDR